MTDTREIDSIEKRHNPWRGLYLSAGVSALFMTALIVTQIAVYAIWMPPSDAEGMLALMGRNPALGLLSMDLLYLVDSVLLVIIYLGLYIALRSTGESPMLIATALGIVGVAAYFASNPAFEMLSLGGAYAAAAPEERVAIIAAARGFMEGYKGTAFNVYYVLNTLYLFIMTPVMRRSGLFGKTAVASGLAAAILMIIPSSVGTIGLYFSLASLAPWLIWLVAVAPRFFALARRPS